MKARIKKHLAILRTQARRRHGVLPTAKWLNENGFFTSYDVVRGAGLLHTFKRAFVR